MASQRPQRIVLIGLSGTGKSSVARLVAGRLALRLRSRPGESPSETGLGWQALDTDEMVVQAAGKSIPDIFAQEGEAAFRRREHEALREACGRRNVVIAAGGGAILSPENRSLLVDDCLLVCLDAKVETLWQRVRPSAEERPLLAGPSTSLRAEALKAEGSGQANDALGRIRDLKAFRHPFYSLADHVVPTDGRSPEEVAEEVVRAWERSRFACAVRTPGGSHGIVVGWDVLDELGALMADAGMKDAAYVVSDATVFPIYGERALASLRGAGFVADAYLVPAGEASKTLETAAAVYDWLVAHRAERRQAVVALGGGVVCNLAGFVAATFLRGVPLVHVPTSLLAMVDAAVGGKTAVNHREAKNIVGAFYQPRLVVADVATLKSLPPRELASGWAEVIKHAFIMDEELLALLEGETEAVAALEPEVTTHVVRRSMALKAAVVSEDEREETGRRTILNYGHTIGHAVEAAGEYGRFLHGEAVAVGMVGATEVGHRLGATPPALAQRQRDLLQRFGLPTEARGLDQGRVMAAMALDKKVSERAIRWVLLEDVGHPVLRSAVPLSLVQEVVAGLL
ncbi:MAG: 3-dehydroquinate synthase [Dehalococcoidia bacterium]